jgi:serine O-acetyltransferase
MTMTIAPPRLSANEVAKRGHELRAALAELGAKEPLLRPWLAALLASGETFSTLLATLLAEKIAGEVLPRVAIREVIVESFEDEAVAARAVADLDAIVARDPAVTDLSEPFLYFKGFHAIQLHRVAHRLWNAGRRPLAVALQSRVAEVFAVDIHPAAPVGSGVFVDHATGLVVGETASIGDDVSILHGVTLGGTGKERGRRHPQIGRGVLIGAGASILGNITVGEGAKIAAGSVVLKDVEPHVTVAGVPARVVARHAVELPALTMEQVWDDYVI